MRIVAWIGGVLAFVLGAMVLIVALIDWNDYRDDVAAFAGDVLGRDVSIGALDVDLGWTTHVRLGKITISNPSWASESRFADIADLKLAVRLWPLIKGHTDMPYLLLSGATVNLRRDDTGRANWQFGTLGDAAARGVTPDQADEFPAIGTLEISDSALSLVDERAQLDLTGKISQAGGSADKADGLTFALTGRLANAPLSVAFSGGPIAILRAGEEPYPVQVEISSGATRITASGTVAAPFARRNLNMRVTAKGPDLGRLFPSLKLPLPNTPPYDLSAGLTMADDKIAVSGLEGKIGKTDISGMMSVALSGEKPFLAGDLVSETLYFDDLAPLFGFPAPSGSTAAPARTDAESERSDPDARAAASGRTRGLFPDIPLDQDRLETVNAELRYTASSIVSKILPVSSISAHIVLKDRRLKISEIETAIAEGRLTGEVTLDARDDVPFTDLAIEFKDLGLKPFFANSRFVEEMGGKFSGAIALAGKGNTIADALSAADGRLRIGIRGGSVSGLLIEAAGLDLIEALVLVIEDARVPIRCGRIDADVEKGLVSLSRIVLDTTDSTLVADGSIDLGTQKLGIQIEARSKDFSLLDLAVPVSVNGTLSDPGIGLGGRDPLPLFEMGDQENVDCAKLLGDDAARPRR